MNPHIIINALAGTGKTLTLVEGVKQLRGIPHVVRPTHQQTQIWNHFGIEPKSSAICLAAFSRHIKQTMENQIDSRLNCDILTFHGMGYRAIRNEVGLKGGLCKLQKNKSRRILQDTHSYSTPGYATTVCRLVKLSKYTNIHVMSNKELTMMAANFDVPLSGNIEQIFDSVREVLHRSLQMLDVVDFDDMPWIPVMLQLPIKEYNTLLVDEGQDLNHIQQQLALMAGKRIILVGDRNQAIYGFTGADTESMNTMHQHLLCDDGIKCFSLPLTVSFRCSQAVTEAAKVIVPEFETNPLNDKGSVNTVSKLPVLNPGDMVLCRINAPLIKVAFDLAASMVPAEVIGRDIKGSLLSIITSMNASSLADLQIQADKQKQKEIAYLDKMGAREMVIMAVYDRYNCLMSFCCHAQSIDDLIRLINTVLTNEPEDSTKPTKVRLSSIHRAKGLEAHNVYIIRPDLIPHPLAQLDWEVEQERNLKYVAITRAKRNLTWVVP